MEFIAPFRRGRSALAFFVLATGLSCLGSARRADAASFQKDDQVVLVRDEPMRLYQATRATGRKGQVFAVLAYTPNDHRVYVLYRDATGQTASLNVAEDAVLLLPGRGEGAFRQALNELKAGRWTDAIRDLNGAAAADPNEMLYADVRSRVDAFTRSLLGVQQAQNARAQAGTLAAQKRHNADMSDRTNPLDPTDNSGKTRAAEARDAADQLEAKADEDLKTATRNLEAILTELDGYVHQRVESRDYDVALAFASVRQRLTAGHRRSSELGSDEAGRFDAALALADARCDAATVDTAASRLYTANREITEGLAAAPTHRGLKAL